MTHRADTIQKILIANRGEVAIRVMRAAGELGIATVGVYSKDDGSALHIRKADEAIQLPGQGAAGYLDGAQMVEAALQSGCGAVHPGYGFLSENAGFARACAEAGVVFVGPTPEVLTLFGDKGRARQLAADHGVSLLPGTTGPTTVKEARDFLSSLGAGSAIMIKAMAGGGGRGIRAVQRLEDVEEALERCRAEALQAFGAGEVYVERLVPRARHIEVQIIGDRAGAVLHLWERECTVQRRNQKLVEVAPSPTLTEALRQRILAAALKLAQAAQVQSLVTFEFLLDDTTLGQAEPEFYFIEANPRLQVEHTVTEQVTGLDLVRLQLQIAGGSTLAELGLSQENTPRPSGYAMQVRVNMETMDADGGVQPAGGALTAFEIPSGPGIRVDTCGYLGYAANPNFDSLLAKVVSHSASPDFADVAVRAYRALCEFRIEGVTTNIPFLQNLLRHPDFRSNAIYTRFVEERGEELVARGSNKHPRLFFETERSEGRAGAKVDPLNPLAVLDFGRSRQAAVNPQGAFSPVESDGRSIIRAPMQGTIVHIAVTAGDEVAPGRPLLIMEAMKMQHEVTASKSGVVRELLVAQGDTVYEGHALFSIDLGDVDVTHATVAEAVDLGRIRPDLAELFERRSFLLDAARPDAVARRVKTHQRTARENIEDLCDSGTFVEYGSLVIAARRTRMPLDELIRKTPADGLITGIGQVNGSLFGEERSRCALLSYDYTVLAGTQGKKNHAKKDRLFELAERWRLPVVFFTEGGGGRPGDTDGQGVAGLHVMAFHLFARLSGLVPLVGINSGRCFAGNAALLGCCDVVIATANSSIGMGGPAMIEGGGLGVFTPEEVGPSSVQVPNGVIDIAVADEAEAVQVAKQYLAYFQGPTAEWECADQRQLRHVVPENRLRVYNIRSVVETLADTGSVLELRQHFGVGMVTALLRIEGRPLGVVANNPAHLAGAIDSDGADKAARFMQLCDAFEIPLLFLCDTPGIMVGPEVEKTALVRHACRLFVTGANLTVPFMTIVLRKAYGLGAQAMAGGSFRAPVFAATWPTGEFGGMGLEGSVKLGFRNELAAIEDPDERMELYQNMVAEAYERGKAISTASYFELDEVIDPAESRRWVLNALCTAKGLPAQRHKKRPNIDTW